MSKEQIILASAVTQFLQDDFSDGDVISHEWLKTYLEIPDPESLADVQRVQFLLLSRVEDFKRVILEEYKIALESIRGVGYRLVPPNEQAEYAVTEAVRYIKKGIDRGLDVLNHARLDSMDFESRKRHIDAQNRMSGLRVVVSKEKRDVFALFSEKQPKAVNGDG